MGLDIYLEWDGQTEADKEAQYKANDVEQYAAAGYLRSSYNDGGFNSWALRHLGKKDLHYIFDYDEEKETEVWSEKYQENVHRFFPDWQASRARALEIVELVETVPPFSVVRVDKAMDVYEKDTVLAAFMKHQERWDAEGDRPEAFEWYSNREGMFFRKDRPKPVAVMWQQGYFGVEAVLICEGDHSYYKSFVRAVVDFIDLALAKPNPRLSWSG